MAQYPAEYLDAHGSVTTFFENDGETLSIRIRNVEFAGTDFDSLEPRNSTPDQLQQFQLNTGELCACRIHFTMPIPICVGDRIFDGRLFVELTLGNSRPNGLLDCEQVRIDLEFDGRRLFGSGRFGWFEDELLELQGQLPQGVYIKSCINCLYSDYSPYGHGLFGGMMCFRNLKAEYLQVTSKAEFWLLHGRQDRMVQETYLCPEFERRVPGTGYRG